MCARKRELEKEREREREIEHVGERRGRIKHQKLACGYQTQIRNRRLCFKIPLFRHFGAAKWKILNRKVFWGRGFGSLRTAEIFLQYTGQYDCLLGPIFPGPWICHRVCEPLINLIADAWVNSAGLMTEAWALYFANKYSSEWHLFLSGWMVINFPHYNAMCNSWMCN